MCARNDFAQSKRTLGENTNTIGVTRHGSDERFGEYFMKFGGIIGPLELSRPGEGMLCVGGARQRLHGLVGDGCYFYHS
jgi:hypothetical protein